MGEPDRGAALRAIVASCTVTATSADHAVRVTAGPGGVVNDLVLTRPAMRHRGAQLGDLIVATINRAAADVTELLAAETNRVTAGRIDIAGLLEGRLPDLPEPAAAATDQMAADNTSSEAAQRLHRLRQEAERQLEGYVAVRNEFADLVTTVAAPDGSVRVAIRGPCTVQAVRIADDALDQDPAGLARLVLATVRAGYAAAAAQLARHAQALTGPRLDLVAMVESFRPSDVDPDARGRPG